MISTRIFNDESAGVVDKLTTICTLLIVVNLVGWAWALVAFRSQPVLLGTALLAYLLGFRHALAADNIAAVDNVARKLMQEGKWPVGLGFFFALGESTIVVLVSLGTAVANVALQSRLELLEAVGRPIGTSISCLFLFAIATANIVVLRNVYRAFRHPASELVEDGHFDFPLLRMLPPVFRFVTHSLHMYPLGLLFGLRFEAAAAIGLLDMSAAGASNGMSIWSIMIFPALSSAGMLLIGAANGILMVGIYGWTLKRPRAKFYYNLTFTSVSVMMALIVGAVKALDLIVQEVGLTGPFWGYVGTVNENFTNLGLLIVIAFVGIGFVSAAIYRIHRH